MNTNTPNNTIIRPHVRLDAPQKRSLVNWLCGWLFGAVLVSAIVAGAMAAGSNLHTFNDNNSAELQKRGFSDISFIYRNQDNSSAYDASLGSCRLTMHLDGPTRQWSVSQAGQTFVNPSAPLLLANPVFAPCK